MGRTENTERRHLRRLDVYKRQHLEPGPDGGLVMIDDTTVLERALKILDEMAVKTEEAVRA